MAGSRQAVGCAYSSRAIAQTVQLDGGQVVTVRLIGMDTPETKKPPTPVQCYGPEASARTAELLPIGSAVGLELDVQRQDRYGRTLAYVWPEGHMLMLNEQLLAEGHAVVLTIPPDVRYVDHFTQAEQIARDNGLGLWSACPGPHEASDDGLVVDDPMPATPTQPAPASKPQASGSGCDPSYPDFCIPPPDPNCDSAVIAGRKRPTVLPPDPHHFDADHDGVGCEPRR